MSLKITSLTFLSAEYLTASMDSLRQLVFVIAMAMGPGLCALCGLIMLHVIMVVQKSRDRILLAFFDLPALVRARAARVGAVARARLRAARPPATHVQPRIICES